MNHYTGFHNSERPWKPHPHRANAVIRHNEFLDQPQLVVFVHTHQRDKFLLQQRETRKRLLRFIAKAGRTKSF